MHIFSLQAGYFNLLVEKKCHSDCNNLQSHPEFPIHGITSAIFGQLLPVHCLVLRCSPFPHGLLHGAKTVHDPHEQPVSRKKYAILVGEVFVFPVIWLMKYD